MPGGSSGNRDVGGLALALLLAALTPFATVACGTDSGSVPQTCDPMKGAPEALDFVATDVVTAGKSADGTLYVLLEVEGRLRMFVGDGAGLTEKHSTGSGQGSEGALRFWIVSFADAGGTTTIEVDRDATGTRLGKLDGVPTPPNKRFTIGTDGEVLTEVPAAEAVAALPTESPTEVILEYSGASTSGTELVVTAPAHRVAFEGFRVFLGPIGALQEQTVIDVTRNLSLPSATFINLTIDGAPAALSYQEGTATLRNGASAEAEFTGATPPSLPNGASFECL